MIETYLILYCVDACTTYLMDVIIENGNNLIIEQGLETELKIYSKWEKLCYSVLIGTTVMAVVGISMANAAAVPLIVPILVVQLQQAA
jgi:hypothetical protein